jgi:hypothetical protein
VDMLPQLLELQFNYPGYTEQHSGYSSVVPLLGHTYIGSDHYIGVVDAVVSRFFLMRPTAVTPLVFRGVLKKGG